MLKYSFKNKIKQIIVFLFFFAILLVIVTVAFYSKTKYVVVNDPVMDFSFNYIWPLLIILHITYITKVIYKIGLKYCARKVFFIILCTIFFPPLYAFLLCLAFTPYVYFFNANIGVQHPLYISGELKSRDCTQGKFATCFHKIEDSSKGLQFTIKREIDFYNEAKIGEKFNIVIFKGSLNLLYIEKH